jgi:hypothetical protein
LAMVSQLGGQGLSRCWLGSPSRAANLWRVESMGARVWRTCIRLSIKRWVSFEWLVGGLCENGHTTS